MNQEGLNLAYKRDYVDDIKKTVVAFANTSGGKIYIGIDDDGDVAGINNPDDVMLRVTNAVRDSIKPALIIYPAKVYVPKVCILDKGLPLFLQQKQPY